MHRTKGASLQSSSRRDRPFVLILHAYSPSNAGDGLLVDLALRTVGRSIGEFDYLIVASDAAGFGDPRVIQWGISNRPSPGPARRASMLLASAVGPTQRIKQAAKDADLIIAVGGAYLRGGGLVEAVKSWGAHYGQLKIAGRWGSKAIYLPQSIGPLSGRYGEATVRQLARLRCVFVRDDKTFQELNSRVAVERVPDMAILEWARESRTPGKLSTHKPILVARDLDSPRRYYEFLEEAAKSGEFDWAVQATGSANDDRPVTARFAPGPTTPLLADVLRDGPPRVVVSTRLHGSLASIIAGFPSIHLTYERKGWSAYNDLGLADFVVSARDARLSEIKSLIERIQASPEEYWSRVSAASSDIRMADDRIRSALRTVTVDDIR